MTTFSNCIQTALNKRFYEFFCAVLHSTHILFLFWPGRDGHTWYERLERTEMGCHVQEAVSLFRLVCGQFPVASSWCQGKITVSIFKLIILSWTFVSHQYGNKVLNSYMCLKKNTTRLSYKVVRPQIIPSRNQAGEFKRVRG